MKKYLCLAIVLFSIQHSKACASFDPDYEYFNIFMQEIIPNKSYIPFLLVYSEPFYTSTHYTPIDENTVNWQSYFHNTFDYTEMDAILKLVNIKHLKNLQKGELSHQLFKKLPANFYSQYKEGIDYLIEAKYLEPYMRVIHDENSDNWYFVKSDKKPITDLDYSKISTDLVNLYKATKNTEIKLRYAFQIVRFQHYNRKFQEAIQAFDTYVKPVKNNSAIYWSAVDQLAGAERGLGELTKANWDFFQVFMHRSNNKEDVYNSMKLTNERDFNSLLDQCKTPEEKNMAYFLLAYNSFTNPIPLMQKMNAIDPNSDILKVLTSRAINQLERSFLPTYYSCDYDNCAKKTNKKIPFYTAQGNYFEDPNIDFINDFLQFLNTSHSKDAFWNYSKAYVYFLKQDYNQSKKLLSEIQTTDSLYVAEIQKLKVLNDIVSHNTIDENFEKELYEKYGNYLEPIVINNDEYILPQTTEFLRDVLANRYFLQGDYAKAFLLNNLLSDLQYNPRVSLVQEVEKFYLKPNKNGFEKFIAKSFDDVGNPSAFFNLIYGDQAMRNASFLEAKQFYSKAINFSGIPRYDYDWENGDTEVKKLSTYKPVEYNGFKNISSLIFGHNVWESFSSPLEISMKDDGISTFAYIPNSLDKLQLAELALKLQTIGNGADKDAALANQLIGNLLYNTSILGYFREVFVMDVNNENGTKFQFQNTDTPFHVYFKDYNLFPFVEPDNFDLSIQYYQKALDISKNQEQKARILFQMASAQQGKYYQWEAKNNQPINFSDEDYDAKYQQQEQFLLSTKNSQYRTYFQILKDQYSHTQTYKDLKSSCLYFDKYVNK